MADAILADVESSGIYQIRNLENGKRYIGSAKCFRVRWDKHLSDLRRGKHHSQYLQRSWDIHGPSAFAFEVVHLCAISDLLGCEQAWIDREAPEYNVCQTAGNCLGVKQSEETKQKRARSLRGRKYPEAAAKRTGMKRTQEQRDRFSAAQKLAFESLSESAKKERADRIAETNRNRLAGRKQSPELIAKRAAGMVGRVVSPETRAKISAANKGRALTAEHRQKLKDRWVGRELSPAMLDALRANAKRRIGVPRPLHVVEAIRATRANWSPEARAKNSASIAATKIGRKISDESIAKRTATRRANGGYAVKGK